MKKNIEPLIRMSKLEYRVFLLGTSLKNWAEVYSSGYFFHPLIFCSCKNWLEKWKGLEDSGAARKEWQASDILMSIEWSNRLYDSIQEKVREHLTKEN